MQHSSDEKKRIRRSADLEQSLAAYYGSLMREQPLSQDAWEQLQRKLNKPARRRLRESIRRIHRPRFRLALRPVPEYVRTAFNHIVYDARVSYPSSLLHCTFKRKLQAPTIHVSSLRKQPIRLLLPVDTERALSALELNLLLATGIARYQLLKRALLIYLLLASFVLFGAFAAFFYALYNRPLVPILIIVIGGSSLLVLLDRQKRRVCYAADALVVLWIGRGRACEGLHGLARVTRYPHRSRWGEPSLAARIEHVCGTQVESRNERLTMVR